MPQREELEKKRMKFLLCSPGTGLCPLWASVPPPGKQQVCLSLPAAPPPLSSVSLDMVPPSEHRLDVAELCLPGSQVCGLEDKEPGRSWPGQRKEGGDARRTEKEEGIWTPELQGGCVS